MKNIYCILGTVLSSRGITLNKVATETGIAYSTLLRLKNNEFDRIDAKTLETVCNFLDLTPGDLIRLRNQEENIQAKQAEIEEWFTESATNTLLDALVEEGKQSQVRRDELITEAVKEFEAKVTAFVNEELKEQRQWRLKVVAELLAILECSQFDDFKKQLEQIDETTTNVNKTYLGMRLAMRQQGRKDEE